MSLEVTELQEPGAEVLLIFIGHSRDADAEVRKLRETESRLQRELNTLIRAGANSSGVRVVQFWEHIEDASNWPGNQATVIDPYVDRADIAVFVFKNRIGFQTWRELEYCRESERQKVVLAFFSKDPPGGQELLDRKKVEDWLELLLRRECLTEAWSESDVSSIRPIDYCGASGLQEVGVEKIKDAIVDVISSRDMLPSCDGRDRALSPLMGDVVFRGNVREPQFPFDGRLTARKDYSPKIIESYRASMREQSRGAGGLSCKEFLESGGYLRDGYLTNAGVLLFTENPHDSLATARVRCVRYDGVLQDSPRLASAVVTGPVQEQIVRVYEFVRKNVGSREFTSEMDVRAEIVYQYPMKCLREVVANALCHRDYGCSCCEVFVRIYKDRVEIGNPGSWEGGNLEGKVRPIPLSFLKGPSRCVNYNLALGISNISLSEMLGGGVSIALADCEEYGARMPQVVESKGTVVVTMFPCAAWADLAEVEIEPEGGKASLAVSMLREADSSCSDRSPEDVLDVLLTRCFPRIRRFFATKVSDRRLVENLMQRTFEVAVDRIRGSDGERTLDGSFLFSVGRVVLLEYYRCVKRDSVENLGDENDRLVGDRAIFELSNDFFDLSNFPLDRRLMISALRRLALDDQIVVELYFFECLPASQICDVLGERESEIRSRIRRAREEMEVVVRKLAESPALLKSTQMTLSRWAQRIREKI
ncbi:MAG: ATP-binding protein [Myxococcota bacterium]